MPDISMCNNKKCKMRYKCFRYMAKPNQYRQSYVSFKPNIKGDCDSFWDIKDAPTNVRKMEDVE